MTTRRTGLALGALAVLAILVGAVLATQESVTLRTRGPDAVRETRVWVADEGLYVWLEAPSAERDWYRDLLHNPLVELRRHGRAHRFRAEPFPSAEDCARVRSLHRRKYGIADRIRQLFGGGDRAIAVRLTRMPEMGSRA